jgi:hypothetical protein
MLAIKVALLSASWMPTFQRILQFFQSFPALFFVQAVLVKPEVFPSRRVFEFIAPAAFQNLDDRLADDKSGGLGESIKTDYTLT